MSKEKKQRVSLARSIIGVIVALLVIFSLIVSVIGSWGFSNQLKKEYAISTYHMADTAASIVNADSIQRYLTEGEDEEYRITKKNLDSYCEKIFVSIVYVIVVDTSDYGHFTSVFNCINNKVDNTNYTPWELGYRRETTNDEYRMKYKRIYEENSSVETLYRLRITDDQHQHITTLVPIKDSSGKVVALLCMQRPISELRKMIIEFVLRILLLAILLSLLSAYIIAKHNKKNFVEPITRISEKAMRFAKGETELQELGEVSNIEEIANLETSLHKMGEDMVKYIDNLTKVVSEKNRIGTELSIAKTIQENSVPNSFPAFPERNDIDIFASMIPAKEVGGDFYNFFLIDDDHLAVIIADVSGKGIPAALFMMVTNILISDRARMGGTPGEILTFVNNNICAHNEADMFVTVWLGIIEISSGKMLVSNAGHDAPAICRKDGVFDTVEMKRDPVVGALPGIRYKDYEISINKGDKLFLYTDGLPEATDKDKKMFKIENMLKVLNENKNETPEGIINVMNESVDEFVGNAPQFDDLTMLCVELKEGDNLNCITVDASVGKLSDVLAFVDGFLEENDCPFKAQMQIDLAVEEVFVNIANYAYGDKDGKAEICIDKTGGEVEIVFRDSGIPYDPVKAEEPDITLSAEERKIGGLGIFLVKKNMDSVNYEYKDNNNILTIKKSI